MVLRIGFILLSLLTVIPFGKAQATNSDLRKNIIYLEAGGVGGYGSLNYERVFTLKNSFSVSARIGLSTIKFKDFNQRINPDILIPIGLNAFYGLDHKLQLGFGQVIGNTVRAGLGNQKTLRKTNLHSYLTVGYRYQKASSRFLFGINYTPFLEFQESFRHWGGLTIGYSF